MPRIIFVTGTDTCVGKTAVTGLLLAHLIEGNVAVRALKPFASGDRTDALLMRDLLNGAHELDEINPYYFSEPVSPWTAARLCGRTIGINEVIEHIRRASELAEVLLVEGAGGLLSPLGERFSAHDLIAALGAETLVVAANRLGVLNAALLTVSVLRSRGAVPCRIALVDHQARDTSGGTNLEDLKVLAAPVEVSRIPFLANYRPDADFVRKAARELAPVLKILSKKNPPDTEPRGLFP